MRFAKLAAALIVGGFIYFGSYGQANAQNCNTVGNTTTCTSAAGLSLTTPGSTAGHVGPAPLTVSGASGNVQTVSVTLNGYSDGNTCCNNSYFMALLLEGPADSGNVKNNLVLMRSVGLGGNADRQGTGTINLAISDGTSQTPQFPTNAVWGHGAGPWKPAAATNAQNGNGVPSFGSNVTVQNIAAPLGTGTLTNVFTGKPANGTWNLYMANDFSTVQNLPQNVTWSSYTLTITTTAASTPTTTTLTPNLTTAFTTSPNNTVSLTANVSPSAATGTIAFTDNGTTISGCGSVPVSTGQAVCNASFSTEGIHPLTATYSGSGTYLTSNGTANVYIQNHSTVSGSTFCNGGPVSSNGKSNLAYSNTVPYPSVISVTGISSVNTLYVTLKNFSTTGVGTLGNTRMLLVAPDNTHAYDFWSSAGLTASAGDYTIQDGAGQIPNTAISPSTYGPTGNNTGDVFTPAPPLPAPQPPATFSLAAPQANAKTFGSAFAGATGTGDWKLFLWDNGGAGQTVTAAGGWCLTISAATGAATTTTVSSSPNPNVGLGNPVQLTATVASSPTPNKGVVAFTENGTAIPGASNTANVSGGVATLSTSSLSEGDHLITATYHDSTGSYNDSFGTISLRVDKATSTPTLNGSTWTYCNTGAITIPAGTVTVNSIGPATPNPSNIVVSNMPGTVSSMSLTLKAFHDNGAQFLQSLLVGPNGGSAPTSTQTLDFFTAAGGSAVFGPQDTTFTDSSATASSSSAPGTSVGPASYGPTPSYTASSFFTLPGSVQRAPSAGAFSFNSTNPVYKNTLPNGTWSLYFNQTTHTTGNGVDNGWCLNIIPTAVSGNGTTSHSPGNFRQGGTGSVSFSLLNNGDSNSKGSTGVPDQAVSHAMTVSGTLPSGLTLGSVPTGTPWNCVAGSSTQVTCTNLSSIAAGSSYPNLTIPVNVASNAPSTATVGGFTFSGAGMTAGTFSSDSITVLPSPVLSVSKTAVGTFTQGQTAQWDIVVSNTAAAAGATDGSTVTVRDPLPSGYTLQSTATGGTWNCSGSTSTVVLCTSTSVVAGQASFQTISVNVNVPANSPVSVSNTASAWGGGDLTHTSQGSAATGLAITPVVQVPATVNLTGGNNQSVAVNTAFPTNLSVTVLDVASVPISGVTVTFTAPASGASGTFALGTNVKTAVTNASGVATATVYTSNATAGSYNISATAGSITNNFTETNIAGTPTQMSANPGTTPQTATVGTAFTNALSVTIKDASNNPVSGKTVTFTAPGSGASAQFSNTTNTIQVITDGTGVASAPATANNTAGGPYQVSAAASGLTTVFFTLTNNGTGPVITTNPTDVSVNSGQNATFTAGASGSPTPTVQWQVSSDGGANYTNLAGATTTTLSFAAVAANNGNKYRAVFTNASGSATTTAATLTVNFAPTVTTNPTSQSVSAGSNASFTAAASGNPTPTVQWQVSTDGGANFSNVAGATSTTLSFATSAVQNGNQYRAVFTNTVGSATTTAATLTVTAGPVITTNPTSITVNSGSNASFTAAASGTPTPTVQWQVSTDGGANYTNLAGATTTTLGFTAAATDNGNKYRAVFTNASGSATTTAATLTVNFAPTVTTNPTSQSVSAGSNASFAAAANGNPTPTVQWQQSTDGGASFQNIAGATSTTLSFTTLASQNGNQYRAVFTNTVGSSTTTAATLTVTAGPVITTNPTSITVNSGSNASFTAAASGTPTPTVQWQVSTDNGSTFSNVAGATTTTLSFTATSSLNGNKYRAVFTNASGSATTTAATLTVNFAPTVTTNPTSQSVSAGSNASFSAAANGNPTPTVQWQVSTDGGATFSNVAGATSTTLTFATAAGDNGKQYRAVFTNTVGSATTTAATLTVTAGPVITTNPTDQTVNAGQTANFTAAASGTPTPTVQWQYSTDGGATFQNVAGATTTTLSVSNVVAGQNGTKFRAVFTNASGSATSTAATLTVNFAPAVTTNPASQSVSVGSNASFTAAASGNPAPTVQWQQSTNGGATFTNIAGATSTTLSFSTNAGQNGNQYRAVFTNTVGSATTTAATLTVTAGPVITTNPTDLTVNNGQNASFSAAASGTPTPTVQWQVSTDGGASFSNIAGATTTSLNFTAASAMNGNKYRAVFTNASGSATTTAATLTVNFAPAVTTNPASQSVSVGSNASFTAAASGNPTPTVQWQVSTDGGATFSNVAGATSTTLSFVTTAGQNGNQYRAVFTNTVGSATTTAATLTVTAGPVVTTNPVDATVTNGQPASFTAAASGTPTPTVQWQVSTDGGASFSNIAGATTTSLNFTAASAMNGNKYRAVFTNASGSATTTAATLTVNFAPAVTTNPASQSVTAGSSTTFTAAASGNPTPTVQWQVSTDGGATFSNVAGATTTTLSFTASVGQSGNQYRAVFTNSVGSATTTAATLTVTAGPVITTNPVSQTVNALSPVSFTAAATGTPAPTVQWQLSTDGGASYSNLPAATSTTLAFTADGSMNGYKYRAVFTNSAGSATTTPATLTVTKLTPTITWSNPADILFGSALGSGQLNATASVAGSLVYTPGIGTVPPVGDGQTLRVDFTPTDTANYTAAFKTVVINVKPTGGSPANLLASSVLTRDGNTNEVIVTVTVANTGGTAASTVLLTAANIGATSTTTQLPIALGSIAAGGQATAVVRLPGSVGTAGTRVVLSLTGSFGGGGSFGGNTRVVLP